MKTPKEYRYEAAHNACVDVYSVGVGSGISVRYNWPFKVVSVDNISPGTADKTHATCDFLWLDSGIGNPDVTNDDVIDMAIEIDADYVIPKDYAANVSDISPGQARTKTTESVREFRRMYAGSECDATYFVPLQPPHDEHVRDFPDEDRFVLGGMKTATPEEQLHYIRAFRSVAGFDVHAHGLGMGASRKLIDTLRNEPDLLDSMDTATPEFAPSRHSTPDKTMKQATGGFVLPGGGGRRQGRRLRPN